MSQPPILVVTTGGTIDKQYFDALSEYQITESVIEKLLKTSRVTRPLPGRGTDAQGQPRPYR